MSDPTERSEAEAQFRPVFAHLGAIVAYARRRGSSDPEGIAAEVMAVAWRRLDDLPRDDPLPWLYATARNLCFAEFRRMSRDRHVPEPAGVTAQEAFLDTLDRDVAAALAELGPLDREALLLIAWEDLTPAQAARALGLKPTAFRVRLLRARRRFRAALEAASSGTARAVTKTRIELEDA